MLCYGEEECVTFLMSNAFSRSFMTVGNSLPCKIRMRYFSILKNKKEYHDFFYLIYWISKYITTACTLFIDCTIKNFFFKTPSWGILIIFVFSIIRINLSLWQCCTLLRLVSVFSPKHCWIQTFFYGRDF